MLLRNPTTGVWQKCNGVWRMGNAGDNCSCSPPAPHYYKIPRNCRDNEPADFGLPDTLAALLNSQPIPDDCPYPETSFSLNGRCYRLDYGDPWLPIENPTVPITTATPSRTCTCQKCMRCLKCQGETCLGKGAYIMLEAYVVATYRVVPLDGDLPMMPSSTGDIDTGHGFVGGATIKSKSVISTSQVNCSSETITEVVNYLLDGSKNEYESTWSGTVQDGKLMGLGRAQDTDYEIVDTCDQYIAQAYNVAHYPQDDYTLVSIYLSKMKLYGSACDCNANCSHDNTAEFAPGGGV